MEADNTPKKRKLTVQEVLEKSDVNGKVVFDKVIEFAEAQKMTIIPGFAGFSLNVALHGQDVAFVYCWPRKADRYSAHHQSITTQLKQRGWRKTAVPPDEVRRLWSEAEATGLFEPVGNLSYTPAGHDLKWPIDRGFTDAEIGKLLAWCKEVAATVRKYGLKRYL